MFEWETTIALKDGREIVVDRPVGEYLVHENGRYNKIDTYLVFEAGYASYRIPLYEVWSITTFGLPKSG